MNIKLNAREVETLEMLAAGASTKKVASCIGKTPGGTRVYLHELYKKLCVANKTEAVV
ncbi:MAG: response regulator transcription factor, partial [Betaproteobacteria bacterium]|nr:response regulator transcription factor [Betaproteobacteria bacterium]